MAKFRLTFLGTESSGSEHKELECFVENGQICINLSDGNKYIHTYLDKSTAIKFAKTVRTEINKIEREVRNG